MPFTFSHAAATFVFSPWLKQNRLSLTGIILGCIAPDFEYFLRMKMQGDIGHNLAGIFLLDLPVALIVAFIFHCLIRDELISNSPLFFKRKFVKFKNIKWFSYFKNNVLIVVVSVLLGISTHILWDSFTHKTGYFVVHFSFLQRELLLYELRIPIYKILQHSSALLGLLAVIFYLFRMPSSAQVKRKAIRKYWGCVFLFLIIFMSIWASFNPSLINHIVHIIVALIACTFWSLVFVSTMFKFYKIISINKKTA